MPEFLTSVVGPQFYQYLLNGLVIGLLYALIALGYTMVYGIIELINFAHGEVFMLGSFLAFQLAWWTVLNDKGEIVAPAWQVAVMLGVILLAAPLFCAALNVTVDRVIYKPLRNAPKLTPLVSAIGVSFILQNVGIFWLGTYDKNVPELIPKTNLTDGTPVRLTYQDLMVLVVTVPTMVALTVFVRYTALGKAMRATAQNPTAARLMGIDVDRVIAATFAIGGALAGVGAIIYGLKIGTVSYQMGFTNGLYAFTAAVLGGIGNIPGAVLGGVLIGLIRELGTGYLGDEWSQPLIFAILIVILIFRPNGLLGARTREKV
jgi:branched-chain amino acid transport system permease protein